MQYAVIELAGKQYKVYKGYTFTVDKLELEEGKTLKVAEVLMLGETEPSEKSVPTVGAPYITGASVTLKALSHQRDKKIRVAQYKSKSRYRKVYGHRQHTITLEVTDIKTK